jgi:predicted RecB family nuclease
MFGRRRLTSREQWVSKTDLSRWYRCPYAFWLLDSGQLTFPETVSAFQMSLIRAGQDYQNLVEQSAAPVVISPADLSALLQTEITILGTPLFENKKLKLRGCPDGIDAANGALYPIEIKSHRAPTHLDRLELAFYWLLLQPYRTHQAPPAGVLILRRDGVPVRVEVPVTDALLGEVRQMIGEVRSARKNGVRPRVCGCLVCSRARRDEVIASVTEHKDVTMILGVGRVYGAALEAAGYATWDTLISCDPQQVADAVTQTGARGCGPVKVADWQLHARALASGLPEFRPGARWPTDDRYIALDLEYDVTPGNDHIWLTGAAVIYPDGADHHSWWADTPQQEGQALIGLAALLDQHPHLRVVTWAGGAADIPRLRAAAARHDLLALGEAVADRHFDAWLWAHHNLRLPTFTLGLKEVSGYLGLRPCTEVADGLDAVLRYHAWLASRDEAIRAELIAYNRGDIDALIHAISRLRDLAPGAKAMLQAQVVIDLDESPLVSCHPRDCLADQELTLRGAGLQWRHHADAALPEPASGRCP